MANARQTSENPSRHGYLFIFHCSSISRIVIIAEYMGDEDFSGKSVLHFSYGYSMGSKHPFFVILIKEINAVALGAA